MFNNSDSIDNRKQSISNNPFSKADNSTQRQIPKDGISSRSRTIGILDGVSNNDRSRQIKQDNKRLDDSIVSSSSRGSIKRNENEKEKQLLPPKNSLISEPILNTPLKNIANAKKGSLKMNQYQPRSSSYQKESKEAKDFKDGKDNNHNNINDEKRRNSDTKDKNNINDNRRGSDLKDRNNNNKNNEKFENRNLNNLYEKYSKNYQQVVESMKDVDFIGNERFKGHDANYVLHELNNNNIRHENQLDGLKEVKEIDKILNNPECSLTNEQRDYLINKKNRFKEEIDLTPLPIKIKSEKMEKTKEDELNKAQRSAVIMRRFEYELKMKGRKSKRSSILNEPASNTSYQTIK